MYLGVGFFADEFLGADIHGALHAGVGDVRDDGLSDQSLLKLYQLILSRWLGRARLFGLDGLDGLAHVSGVDRTPLEQGGFKAGLLRTRR